MTIITVSTVKVKMIFEDKQYLKDLIVYRYRKID